ncbi:MAG TPA: hypothetical protein VIJ61_14605, partial [Thermoanaerobaculia bacterium]
RAEPPAFRAVFRPLRAVFRAELLDAWPPFLAAFLDARPLFRAALFDARLLFRAELLDARLLFRAALFDARLLFRAALLEARPPFLAAFFDARLLFRAVRRPFLAVLRAERLSVLADFRAAFRADLWPLLPPDDSASEESPKSNERDDPGFDELLSEGSGSIHPEPDQPISI